jgi:hypothetical protein
MKIVHEETLMNYGAIGETEEWRTIHTEIREAIAAVVWPPSSKQFVINPTLHGNGVKPIKDGCLLASRNKFGWKLETPIFIRETRKPGKVDALRSTTHGDVVFEWETGNISSSHRALNKITLGLINGLIIGGILVLPTR